MAKFIGVLKQTNTAILTVLKSDSEVLERIQNSFHTMIRARDQDGLAPIAITCFFEELPLPGIGVVSQRVPFSITGKLIYRRLCHLTLLFYPAIFPSA